jgi:outer membrane receptor protein involved in Fe transport
MEFRTYRRAQTCVCLLASVLARWAAAAEPSLPPQEFHVSQGDATRTLTDFSRQAHLQLLFDYNIVKGHATPPLEGTYTPGDALRRLLAHTNLEFDFVNERTLAVMQKPSPAAEKHPTTEPAHVSVPKSQAAPTPAPSATVEVVRVTGTYVRNEPPIGEEVIGASRADIEATGAATAADFLSTLPQTFGGGPNQDTHIGLEAMTNSGLGVGVNLRGLGARATLVLIDGHRVAPSGTQGQYVDVENIPLSAIQRIDILPDSVSATYGADAVGGVVNFVLRKQFDGAETVARGGSGTRGDLKEYLLSQTLGDEWSGGHGLIAMEFYERGALPAADRAYATSDLRSLGGGDFNTNLTNPGNIINPQTGQTWAIPAGQNGRHLSASDLVPGTSNQQNRYLGGEIIPSQKRWTLYASASQTLGDPITLFTDLLLGHREASQVYEGIGGALPVPNTNPFYVNPVGGTTPVVVAYNFGKDLGPLTGQAAIDTLNATLGADFAVGGSWIVTTYGAYSREKQNIVYHNEPNATAVSVALADSNPLTAFNPFGDGSNTSAATLQAIRTDDSYWLDSQLKTIDVAADGPVTRLAGIPLKLAFGADWREQRFATSALTPGTQTSLNFNLGRRAGSAFGQIIVPLFTEAAATPAMRTLEFSAAARYEDYQIFGHDTTPKLGLVWSPLAGIAFRGTWSRSARPPTLVDLDATQNRTVIWPVTQAGGSTTTALLWSGGNAHLQPEHAQSWTVGLDLAPDFVPGLAVGLTWFRTSFKDRLQDTPYSPTMLVDPAYAVIVAHNPTPAQIAAACNGSVFSQGSNAQCLNTPVGALVDLRVRNLARLQTDGIDFNTSYAHPTTLGELKLVLSGTWLKDFLEAQTPDQPLASLLNTQNQPIDLRMRASAGWEYRGWGALVAANFTDSYKDTASIPQRRVDAWTTIDVQLRYEFPMQASSWMSGLDVELNARNVFNVDPPFFNNQATYIGYDQENADPYGRLLSLQLRKRW